MKGRRTDPVEGPDFSFEVPDWARDRTTKRAVTFFLRTCRLYASGAASLVAEGEDETALIAITMSNEALEEAERLLQWRVHVPPEQDPVA